MSYLTIILAAIVILLIAKYVLHFNVRKLVALIINFLLGILVLWLINRFLPGVNIPINIITGLVVGILGLPGVIILLLLNLIGLI